MKNVITIFNNGVIYKYDLHAGDNVKGLASQIRKDTGCTEPLDCYVGRSEFPEGFIAENLESEGIEEL